MKWPFFNSVILICMSLISLSSHAKAQDVKNGLRNVGVNYYMEHVWEPANLDWHIFSVEMNWRMGAQAEGVSAVLVPRLRAEYFLPKRRV